MIRIYRQERFTRLPDALLFDTDNTLYAYDPAHEAALRAVREKMAQAFAIRAADFDEPFEEARRQTKLQLAGTAASHSRLL